MQQMLLGVGKPITRTYIDDVYSTNVYTGAGSGQVINNGIDNSTEGGMVWFKRRDGTYDHQLVDTVRGGSKGVQSNTQNGTVNTQYISSFNTNGYTLGSEAAASQSGLSFAAWNFRKTPGFFDVVTYSGNDSSGRQVSHNLGSVPGLILIKKTSSTSDWCVYHRSLGATKFLILNEPNNAGTTSNRWNDTTPTATNFTLGSHNIVNGSGQTYVAYLFAGGESTAATARSVDFDGSDDALLIGGSSGHNDLYGPGDFTLEAWIKPHNWSHGSYQKIYENSATGGMILGQNSNDFGFRTYGTSGNNPKINFDLSDIPEHQWSHIAVTRSGTTIKLFLNGVEKGNVTSSYSFLADGQTTIGTDIWDSDFDGEISNLRYVKGTAVYTSSFRPPTEPLTNITNTKLLCCNNSSTTGSTVTPATITTAGNPTASTDSPFDDPAAQVFGASGSESVIKCGSYVGNGSNNGPEVNLGFEPQWLLLKSTGPVGSENWRLYDNMRGVPVEGDDKALLPSTSHAELSYSNRINFTSTGFQITTNNSAINRNDDPVVYCAIRRPDGYVGKPPELGTGVLSLATGTNNTIPGFVSGFPVDFSLRKIYASSGDWFAASRLTGTRYLITNATSAENSNSNQTFDFQNGIGKWGGNLTTYMSWQWKRHAGFDVVTYTGLGASSAPRSFAHSLGKTPEMIWTKGRNSTYSWRVWHKDLGSGGTSAAPYYLVLNATDAQTANGDVFGGSGNALPTSTHWTTGGNAAINENGTDQITMLFASVNGISKVGSYTGTASTQTITTGFQPRFLIIKAAAHSSSWGVHDTVRGWGAGDDPYVRLNNSNAEVDIDIGAPTSTGFTLTTDHSSYNGNGYKYIYYAHA